MVDIALAVLWSLASGIMMVTAHWWHKANRRSMAVLSGLQATLYLLIAGFYFLR